MTAKMLHYVVEFENGSKFDVKVDPNDPSVLTVDGVARDLKVEESHAGLVVATADGQRVPLQLRYEHGELVALTPDGARQRIRVHLAETLEFRERVLSQPPPPPIEHSGRLTAPIAGNIVSFAVAEGADVKVGDPLLVLEAMKMQNSITSPAAGVVSFKGTVGQIVRTGDLLAIIVAKGSN